MKTKNKRSLIISMLAAVLALTIFTACSMQLSFEDSDTENDAVSDSDTGVQNESTRDASVYIIQYMNYSSLNECCEGVKSSFDSAGIGYNVIVGTNGSEKEDCENAAKDIATNNLCDLVVVIGTPCAEVVCPIISSASTTPVVFCAVTDPVSAGIVDNLNAPGKNCTGVASAFNINEQLNMINTFQPYITRLGVIYSGSEQNAVSQLKSLKKAAAKLNITVYDEEVDDPSQYGSTAQELMKKVEAVVLLPDNMIAKNSWGITEKSIVEKVPLYGVTLPQVQEGCLAGYCYDFCELGKKAGDQAVSILHGDSAAQSPVIMERECKLYVNKDILSDLDMSVPDEYKNIAEEIATSYEN